MRANVFSYRQIKGRMLKKMWNPFTYTMREIAISKSPTLVRDLTKFLTGCTYIYVFA